MQEYLLRQLYTLTEFHPGKLFIIAIIFSVTIHPIFFFALPLFCYFITRPIKRKEDALYEQQKEKEWNEKKAERKKEYHEYLKSDAWKRKRYVVLKRDAWTCQQCGAKATDVHHKKYAKHNIGREPIEWLISLCRNCHDDIHNH